MPKLSELFNKEDKTKYQDHSNLHHSNGERFCRLNTPYNCRRGRKKESYHLACFAIRAV